MSAKEQRRQQIIFLVVVLLVMLISIGLGMYFSGFRIGSFGDTGTDSGDGVTGERYATMTDAQLICEERARKVFGERIRTLTVDTHSSRLDKQAGLFRVFMESDLYANDTRQGSPVRHFINCYARTDRVAIASFQFAKDGETMKDPGGSIFGF
jgi:hypothetical protein